VYNSTSPPGACIALPRTNTANTQINLLGIICVGKEVVDGKSSSCFWDNQVFASGGSMTGDVTESFPIPVGDGVPLSNFMGGAALVGGAAGPGRCSHCHAGENPFVIHPDTALGSPDLDVNGDLQKMPDVAHSPLVHPSWNQNEFASTLINESEASDCVGCHSQPARGSLNLSRAGRFPKLTPDIRTEYCTAVLKRAININSMTDPANTMPYGGTLSGTDHAALVAVIDDFCNNGADVSEIWGDPHITTTNGVDYDFQAAGEYVLLKDQATFEVQARLTPIATSFFPGPNTHTGVASCVSINTAVAARVGDSRVTFQPRLDGVPDPTGMELRIDGALTSLTARGVRLPDGGRVRKSGVGGLEIEFSNGEYLSAEPGFWDSQGHWYLNISIAHAEARKGVMGSIPAGSWLPRLPDGTSLGPQPASAIDRYNVLNGKFAEAWRVKDATSLFAYAVGQGPASFNFPGWPKTEPACEVPDKVATPPATAAAASAACSGIVDDNHRANCVFDFALTGAEIFPKTYERSQRLREGAVKIRIITVAGRGRPRAERTYGVYVAPRWLRGLQRQPKGGVQIAIDGENVGGARPVDQDGIAYFDGDEVADGDGIVTATFTPDPNSPYLPGAGGLITLNELDGVGTDSTAPDNSIIKRLKEMGTLICTIILMMAFIILLIFIVLKRQR
jgi:hypothetical protein